MSVDVMNTPHGVSTFNVLLTEGRRVAGAFLTAGQTELPTAPRAAAAVE